MGAKSTQSLTDQAYTTLEGLIVTLKIAPEQSISEGEFCEQTGFGHTPLREALQRLAQQHLISIFARRGIIVTEINVETKLQLLELRREIGRLVLRLAARRRTDAEHLQFAEIATAMEEAAEPNNEERFMVLDDAFNALVGTACRNAFAQTSMEQWSPLSRRFWYGHHALVGDLPKMAALHADIAWAIVAGDAGAAARTSDLLVDYLTGFTRATLDAGY